MIKSLKFLFLFLLIGFSDAFASHYMGGEITWQCLANGRYRFVMKLYRECNGITYGNTEILDVAGYAGLTAINMSLYPGGNPRDGSDGPMDGKTDLSPDCWIGTQEIKCSPNPSTPNTGAVEEWYYTSDASYPIGVQLTGVPPASGWVFSHDGCCRNPCSNLQNPTSGNWFLRAIMYPYQGTNAFPCYDNSPSFAEVPSTVICTGYPFKYNHHASDKELDSLDYQWAPALNGSLTTPMVYMAPYTFNSPLPGPAQNPANVAATMNSFTGEISYTSFTNGAYVTVTKVTAYRCDIKIAEIFREMQIVLLNCPGSNAPPTVDGVFFNSVTGQMEFRDTVCAGDIVNFDIMAIDAGTLPNGNFQTVTMQASGQDFGTGYTNAAAGCATPPCATLSPPPVLIAQLAVGTHFNWQTTCDHLAATNCIAVTNSHNFVIKAADNYCPANGITINTITVVVVNCTINVAQLKCTEVHPNGDITITWVPPPDPRNLFESYHIYHSHNANGPYTRIDSIFNYNITSATYSGLSGNTLNNYFYMRVRSGCPNKLIWTPQTSDTLRTILLDVAVNPAGDVATLNWNPIHVPLLGSSMQHYQIYREFPLGTWSWIDSTQFLTYTDSIVVCDDSVKYRIEIPDTTGCISKSSIDGGLFHDAGPPALVVLDSVSIDQLAGKAILGWQASLDPDVVKYYIYYFTGGVWTLADSVNVPATSYVHLPSNPTVSPESYRIAAVDSCKKLSPMSPEHKTIYLSPMTLFACADKVHLEWTDYINFDPPLSGYRIWVSENGGPITLLTTTGTGVLAYDHLNVTPNSTYCYYIQAADGTPTKFSRSNIQCITMVKPGQPKYVYLRYATVVNNKDAEIGFFVDTTAYITKYKVLRSEDGVNYTSLVDLPPTNPYANISYVDATAVVNEKSYYYKVIVVDSCNVDILTSNVGRTIFLQGDMEAYMSNSLDWNLYESRTPLAYDIYREVEDFEPYLKTASMPMSATHYLDDVQTYTESGGRFRYVVQAPLFDLFNGIHTFTDTSISNEVIIVQPPRLYVPNAFTPGGLNPIFKPIGVYTEKSDYYFIIYDRWGQIVFETKDYNQGWDGTYKGKMCEVGVYSYVIHITNAFNKPMIKRGIVTLVR